MVVINFGESRCNVDCSCELFDVPYTKGQLILDTVQNAEKEELTDLKNLVMEVGQAKVIQLKE